MMKIVQSAYHRTISLEKMTLILLILFLQLSFFSFANADSSSTGLMPNSMSQDIVLDPWGNIFYYDSYDISNLGETRIDEISLQLPKEAEDVTVYDIIDSLSFMSYDVEDAKMVTITFRYPLRGEEGGIVYNDSCSFTVKYRVNAQKCVTQMKLWSRYRFETCVSTNLNWTIKNGVVKITLPEGAKCLQTTPSNGNVSKNLFTHSITYVFQNVTSATDFDLVVEYEYLIFWSAFRPTLWIGMIAAIIGVITIFRRRGRPSLPVVSGRNVELIRSFVETCDRRLMLWSEVESLEESLDDKRIGKKDYNRRKRILEQRIRVLNKAFGNLTNRLRRVGVRYNSFVERIEKSEGEIEALKADIKRLRTQYRSRKLSKNAYRKLRRSYNRRIERATADIEGIIIELKGEVG